MPELRNTSVRPAEPAADHAASAHRYISDNPYRLLSLASSTPAKTLRQKAAAADQALKVGLPVAVSLEVDFGRVDLSHCVDNVRGIIANAVARTIYRQMWPYESPGKVDTVDELVSTADSDRPHFFAVQSEFVAHACRFALAPGAETAEFLLNSFCEIYFDEEHEKYLIDLLVEEGETSEAATDAVVDAQNTLALHLISDVCSRAIRMLESRRPDDFERMIAVVDRMDFDKDAVTETMINTFSPFAGRLLGAVESSTEEKVKLVSDPDFWRSKVVIDIDPYWMLLAVGNGLEHRSPGAAVWKEKAWNQSGRLAYTLATRCDPRSVESGKEAAQMFDLFAVLRTLPLTPEAYARLNEACDILTAFRGGWHFERATAVSSGAVNVENIAPAEWLVGGRPEEALSTENDVPPPAAPPSFAARVAIWLKSANWRRAGPLRKQPRVKSILGTGLRAYTRVAHWSGPKRFKTTVYLCLFGIPIWPLQSYAASDDGAEMQFFGKLPFTPGEKLHVGAVTCLACLVYLFYSAGMFPGAPPSTPVAASPAPAAAPAPAASTSDDDTELLSVIYRLRGELDSDDLKLKAEKQALDAQYARWHNDDAVVGASERLVDKTDEASIDKYNDAVKRVNRELGAYKQAAARFNKHVDEHNAKVNELKATQAKYDRVNKEDGG